MVDLVESGVISSVASVDHVSLLKDMQDHEPSVHLLSVKDLRPTSDIVAVGSG